MRHKMSRRASRKNFRRGTRVNVENSHPLPQRGGWRL